MHLMGARNAGARPNPWTRVRGTACPTELSNVGQLKGNRGRRAGKPIITRVKGTTTKVTKIDGTVEHRPAVTRQQADKLVRESRATADRRSTSQADRL